MRLDATCRSAIAYYLQSTSNIADNALVSHFATKFDRKRGKKISPTRLKRKIPIFETL